MSDFNEHKITTVSIFMNFYNNETYRYNLLSKN